jgi:hypothetical protein
VALTRTLGALLPEEVAEKQQQQQQTRRLRLYREASRLPLSRAAAAVM